MSNINKKLRKPLTKYYFNTKFVPAQFPEPNSIPWLRARSTRSDRTGPSHQGYFPCSAWPRSASPNWSETKKSLIVDFELNQKQKTVDIFITNLNSSVRKIENCQFKMFSFFTQNKVSREPNLIKLSKYLFSSSVA